MFIETVTPRGLLSFAPDSAPIKLQQLNVLIGANGAGKSNLIEAVKIMKSFGSYLSRVEISDLLWRGTGTTNEASIDIVVSDPLSGPVEHRVWFDTTSYGPQTTPGASTALDVVQLFSGRDFSSKLTYQSMVTSLQCMLKDPKANIRFTELIREVWPHVDYVEILPDCNIWLRHVSDVCGQILFVNGTEKLPVNCLSDGILRWVNLLTLLLDTANHGPVFLDGPDVELHQDTMGSLAGLIKEAATRRQVTLVTHNVQLLDHFTETPEAVVVVENDHGYRDVSPGSKFRRLTADDVPEDMMLGEAWQRGMLGGVRW